MLEEAATRTPVAWESASGGSYIGLRGEAAASSGERVRFYLALDRRHDLRLLSGFVHASLLGLTLLLTAVAFGAWLIATTGLAPLRRFGRLAATSARNPSVSDCPLSVFDVTDMTYGHCISTITKAIAAADPGSSVNVDLAAKRVHVSGAKVLQSALLAAINDAGYTARSLPENAAPATTSTGRGHCCS